MSGNPIAAIYGSSSDVLLRQMTRDGLMKLGFDCRLLNPSLFDPVNASIDNHDIAVVPALHGSFAMIAAAYKRLGKPVLLVGRPLFRSENLVRVTLADPNWLPTLEGKAESRLKLIGNPKVETGSLPRNAPIVILGQFIEGDENHEKLKQWTKDALDTIRKVSDLPVVWKPSLRNILSLPGADEVAINESFDSILERTSLVVTHSSPHALRALLKGVPLITHESSMFADVSVRMNSFGKAKRASDQDLSSVLQALSYIHWERSEIVSGEALNLIISCIKGARIPADKVKAPNVVMSAPAQAKTALVEEDSPESKPVTAAPVVVAASDTQDTLGSETEPAEIREVTAPEPKEEKPPARRRGRRAK